MSWEDVIKEDSEKKLRLKLKREGNDDAAINESIYRVNQKVADGKIEFSEKEVKNVIKEIYNRRLGNLFG